MTTTAPFLEDSSSELLSTRFCSFCHHPGHTIRTCSDERITECWKATLCQTDIRVGSRMDDEDLYDVQDYLASLSTTFLTAMGVKYARTHLTDSPTVHIHHLLNRIIAEAIMFENLTMCDQRAKLRWIDPESYSDDEEDEDSR